MSRAGPVGPGAASRELGPLDGPMLLFGGPYGNREATEALLAEAERRRIPWDHVICTGDLAAYCADPQACCDLIRARGIATVMGNCEEQLALDASDCGCGFAEGSRCLALSEAWFAYCRTALDRGTKAWMGGLPRTVTFTLGGRRFAVIHGAVTRINGFIFASTPQAEKAAELACAAAAWGAALDGIVGGHCGLPFTGFVGGRLWHNAGAIGMPANDGTPRVWYSLMAPRADGIEIRHHSLDYDYRAAARNLRACGLPEAYAIGLETGLWPSCDILPPVECNRRGRPLADHTHYWPAPAGPR